MIFVVRFTLVVAGSEAQLSGRDMFGVNQVLGIESAGPGLSLLVSCCSSSSSFWTLKFPRPTVRYSFSNLSRRLRSARAASILSLQLSLNAFLSIFL